MSTGFVPQSAIENNYAPEGTDAQNVAIFFLDATVTTAQDSWKTKQDLPGLLPTTGSYNSFTGIAAGAWPWKRSPDGSTVELSLPTSTWTSTNTYSLTFRWIVFTIRANDILTMVDLGAAHTLSAATLQLTASESPYISGSYSVFRVRRGTVDTFTAGFVPQSAVENHYTPEGTDAQNVSIFLMDSTVTAPDDSWKTVADLPGLLATTGPYNGSNGIAAGAWPWKRSPDGSTVELSLPGSTWTSSATYSLAFRWIVFAVGFSNSILSTVDMGSTQTLTAAPLELSTTESGYIAGSYPVFRVGLGRVPTQDAFILGATKPVLTDPFNPTVLDNVGAAFGWNGVSLTVQSGDYTIPANTTVTNMHFTGYVTFTDTTSVAQNCVFEGRAPGGAFSAGLIKGGAGGTLNRCSLVGTTDSATYYMDGIESTGGTWTLTRCSISHVVDSVHANGGTVKLFGCKLGPYSFWDTDSNHSSDSAHPWWSHADTGMQRLSGLTNNDVIQGCSIVGFFDHTGVTSSGGHYVNGSSTIGNPAAAMNGNGRDVSGSYLGNGSTTAYPHGNYANLITYSNTSPYSGMVIKDNWLDGGSYPSGLIQITTGSGHSVTITGNRFGLGGKPGGGSNTIFLISYPTDTRVTQSGNVYDPDNANVPSDLKGQPLTFTTGGAKITGRTDVGGSY